jgi:hypothetical protein
VRSAFADYVEMTLRGGTPDVKGLASPVADLRHGRPFICSWHLRRRLSRLAENRISERSTPEVLSGWLGDQHMGLPGARIGGAPLTFYKTPV